MALLALQTIKAAGLVPTTTAAAGGGDTVQLAQTNDDRTLLQVTNGAGTSMTVTVADSGVTGAGNPATVTPITVAAGATCLVPLNPAAVNLATGLISITYSAVTTVTVAAIRR